MQQHDSSWMGLDADEIFTILSNERRREALRYLRVSGGHVPTGELAEHVAAVELGIPVEELDTTARKRVYISLYQVHLPMMDETGAIEFDKDRGAVRLTNLAAVLYAHLDLVDQQPTTNQTHSTLLSR